MIPPLLLRLLTSARFWAVTLIAILSVALLRTCASLKSIRQERSELQQAVRAAGTQISTYQLRNGQLVAESEHLRVSLSTARSIAQQQQYAYLDTLHGLRKNLRNLQAATQLHLTVFDTTKVPPEVLAAKDTTIHTTTPFFDRHLKIDTSGMVITTQYFAPISIAVYYTYDSWWARLWGIERRRRYKAAATSGNPAVTITDISSFSISEQ